MSGFANYDYPQGQQGPDDASGAGPGPVPNQQQQQQQQQQQPQQPPPMGQPADNSPGAFPGGNGEPGSAGGPQQGGDAKTTLW